MGQAIDRALLYLNTHPPLRDQDAKSREEGRRIVDLACRAIKKIPELAGKGLSARLGGKIPPEYWDTSEGRSLRSFLETNHLQHKIFHMDHQIGFAGRTPLLRIDGKQIPWSEITWEKSSEGYSASRSHQLLFKTDTDKKLRREYSYQYGGIIPRPLQGNKEWVPYDIRPPSNERLLEVWTSIQRPDRPTFMGDHSWIVLKEPTGEVRSIGQFGTNLDITCGEMLSGFSHKPGGLEAPDRYQYLPSGKNLVTRWTIPITVEQASQLKENVEEDLNDPGFTVSILKSNCTSFVVKQLHQIGIQADAKITIPAIVLRRSLPIRLIRFWERLFPHSSRWIYLFPPVYLLHLITGHIIKLMSLKGGSDLSWWDLYFRPWNSWVDHPLRLNEWMAKNRAGC